ncbi:PH domain-containing protein [Luteolibacter marinus]|uniref:PH domain-containing protein n=1 Tax=Luteolibacter marinus TaxID=2776705 RepID=UPI0018693F87|nr:PH domain-containing protein [Luteolibacter marinus]
MSSRENSEWFYGSAEGERVGPVSIGELSRLAGQGKVGPKTLVWSFGYPDWIPAEQIGDLLMAARDAVPANPVPTTVPAAEGPPSTEETGVGAAATEEGAAVDCQVIKPRKGSFVFPRIVLGLAVCLLLGGVTAGVLISMKMAPWPGLAVFAAGVVLAVAGSFVAYRKESYEIQSSRLFCHRGGLVSDQTTELEIRNITHVKLKLPWLRYKIFGVGNLSVETAGNAQPVVMRAIRGPEAVYAGLQERMKGNGYDLTRRELLHEEQPAVIGALAECFGMAGGGAVAIAYISAIFLGASEAAKSPVIDTLALAGIGLAGLILVASVVVHFLDLRRRSYRVFNDVVVYDEGFLTRHHAFIPYENIADSNTRCSFLDRLLGLFDVQVSCQGSGREIKFRRLRNGVALSAAIDHLVVLARGKQKPAASGNSLSSARRARRGEPDPVPAGEAMVAELRMHAGRTLVPLMLLLPLFPIWIAAMIQAVIRVACTQYSVRPGSVRHSFRFLTVNDREFAYDKITGVVISRNPWDRLFGTLTVRFWSLGSGQSLEFSHVHAAQFDVEALLRQAGIPAPSPAPHEAKAAFSVFAWLRGGLKHLPSLALMAAGIVVAAEQVDRILYSLLVLPASIAMGACIVAKLRASRQRLLFHDHFVEAEQGVFAKRHFLARYGNIKRLKVTRYPGGETGDLEVFVAGEEVQQQADKGDKNGSVKITRPCSFTSRFLPDVSGTGLLLDDILDGRADPTPRAVSAEPLELLLESKRAVGNAVVKLILLSILLLPLVVLLPLTIPLTVWRVKRWRYRVDPSRVVAAWGIFYRSESSILLDRVDSLQQSQGPVNKLFRNGNVTLMTAGSSKPDLKLPDASSFPDLYRTIRELAR